MTEFDVNLYLTDCSIEIAKVPALAKLTKYQPVTLFR